MYTWRLLIILTRKVQQKVTASAGEMAREGEKTLPRVREMFYENGLRAPVHGLLTLYA
jgi:hypothetical protein